MKEVLDETFKEVSKALNISFKYNFYLENEDLDGADEFNLKEYNTIRGKIFSIDFHLDAKMVRTWTDIC